MRDTASKMPARIWAGGGTYSQPRFWSQHTPTGSGDMNAVAYIRADIVEAMAGALEAANGRITALYSAINPHANYYDGGNRMADSDEVAQQARVALNSYREASNVKS